jgi:hypothetical protein
MRNEYDQGDYNHEQADAWARTVVGPITIEPYRDMGLYTRSYDGWTHTVSIGDVWVGNFIHASPDNPYARLEVSYPWPVSDVLFDQAVEAFVKFLGPGMPSNSDQSIAWELTP